MCGRDRGAYGVVGEHPGHRRLRWGLIACVVLAGGVVGGSEAPALADTSMRPLEEALGDSLEVRRDPPEGPDGDRPASDPTADGEGAPDGGGDGDGMRDPVPPGPDDGADADTSDGDPASGTDARPGAEPDLDDAGENVEGEGRGLGELTSGMPDRTVPILVAVFAVVGASATIVRTQRRWERGRA